MASKGRRLFRRMSGRCQRDVISDVMHSAAQCETWLTLDELAKLTKFPPASISAQLRHLRKPQHGGYAVEKRCRELPGALREAGHGAVWEYKLSGKRELRVRRPCRPKRFAAALCVR
jgi:hypothetical protein